MIGKIIDFFKKKPGLLILVIILSIITAVNIKPDFFLVGWDNYSSYFNLKTNIFRTFFATWREYRGLGVPSDSEVTDIFRQIFFWIAHFILPKQLLDQIYYQISLWVGILSMYGLAKIVFNKEKRSDLFGTIAGLFYLFNLNTLSVFYSPIIPFTNRFYTLPLLLYLFLKFIDKKSKKNLAFLILAIFLSSGSYITPTLIITSTIAIFVFLFFWLDIKKSFFYLIIYLLLNSFWILPFLNYTIQKSSIVPLARTFIEINESTLNRSPSTFSLSKQALLYPSFFDINFSSQNTQAFTIHPQLYEFGRDPIKIILFLFPILYCIGGLLILSQWKNEKKSLWIPFWILIFLFLSTKEYGLFGFIYGWLTKIIPFFDVIFRISDTKFHAYISLAGSIGAAYAILSIIAFFKSGRYKKIVLTGFVVLSLGYVFLFRSYFSGNLIGFFSYNKIPQAYFDAAGIINSDPEKGRVLHLPMDQWQHYWRSFSWGYLGSAFFNFLIDKPYIDKTFEPASMENAYLHSQINNLLDIFYRTTDLAQKDNTASEFLSLLRKAGTKYVLIDESISSDIYARNIIYTAKQSYIKSFEMLNYLSSKGESALLANFPINLQEQYATYKELYPANKTGLSENLPTQSNIYLYEIFQSRPTFSLANYKVNVDPNLNNLLETQIDLSSEKVITQHSSQPAKIIPFANQNHKLLEGDGFFTLEFKNPNISPLRYQINTTPTNINSYLIDVYGNIKNQKFNLSFYHRYYPDINGQRFNQYLGSLDFPLSKNIPDGHRLKLNDVFTKLPEDLTSEDRLISSYIISEKTIRVELLEKIVEKNLNLSTFTKTDPTTCYGPQSPGYEEISQITPSYISLESKMGSICINSSLDLIADNDKPQYVELEILEKGNQKELDDVIQSYVCVHQGNVPDCLNLHRQLRLFPEIKSYRLSLSSYLVPESGASIQIGSIPQMNIKQKIDINGIVEHIYSPISDQELPFNPVFPEETINISGPLQITVPKALSPFSYFHQPESELYDLSQNPCHGDPPEKRNMNFIGDMLYNEMENCDVFFAQKFQYAFGHPYLFAYTYLLNSGQQPNILLGREGDNYLLEKASLYQGYPNLKGKLTLASRLFEPGALSDTVSKDMSIHLTQDTANKGGLGISSFDMVEYPSSWYNLNLTPEGIESIYSDSGNISSKEILPSLWKVDIENFVSPNFLIFNEGYDKQWGVYDNFFNLVFGKSSSNSIHCDGYANCFEISSPNFYILYWPERLYFLGWLATILAIIFSFNFLKKGSFKRE